MPAVTGDVPNLINGISQQSPSMRLPSQGKICENYANSLLDGLTKRPRTDHLAKLFASLPANAFTHIILRDATEKYVVVITDDGVVKVYDFQGTLKSVTNNTGSYLTSLTDPKNELRALTIADHTFIVNKSKVVAAGTATSPTRPPGEALYNVMAGNYGKTYKIWVNNVVAVSYTTPDGSVASHSNYIDTNYIANVLLQGTDGTGTSGAAGGGAENFGGGPNGTGGLVAAGLNTSPWACGRFGHVIYLRNSSVDFTTSVEDGYSGRAMKAIKKEVQKFSDLPTRALDGFVVKITGAEETTFDEYWVKFVSNDAQNSGVWEECVAPNTVLGLNAATMPQLLVRNANGTFTIGPATWTDRTCGDTEKVPDPSFVGHTIEDIFFHRNRLGILTKDNVVLSEAGKYYNFYRTTLTALLDTDPVDVAASHVKVSLLYHAVPFQDVLMLFSAETQFKLAGNELLTPKTVNARPLTELPALTTVRPVVTGGSIYFVSERARWANLFEYFLDKQLESADYDDVSGHAPAYIPSGVTKIIGSPDLDIVLCLTDGDPAAIYTYKYHYNGQEKLQSAWSRWTFPGVTKIRNFDFDKGYVEMILDRSDGVYLERLNIEQRVDDEAGFTIYLDQHVTLTGTYSAGTNTTTFTLPYAYSANLKAVTDTGGVNDLPRGVELQPVSTTSSTMVFAGNLSTQPLRIGLPYRSEYEFSHFFYRGTDGKKSVTDGRLQVLTLSLQYSAASYFRVEVTPDGRSTRTYTFTGNKVGEAVTGAITPASGRMNIPIRARNNRASIKIINDSWLPSSFSSATWRGIFNPANREK